MTALHRKLLRDLLGLKGQVVTIALVVAAGVASYVSLVSTWRCLTQSREQYYAASRFADVFVSVKRAPVEILDRMAKLPGVSQVEGRIVHLIALDVPELAEPAMGMLNSLPPGGSLLDVVSIREGRPPEPGRPDEVLVNEGFARAHRLRPGGTVIAVVNGRRATLRVTGIALSPEYVFAIPPTGGAVDDLSYGVFWMDRTALASAFRMEGAFNNAVLRVSPGVSVDGVLERVDTLLEPYGNLGAKPRSLQPSERVLDSEIRQLEVEATIIPIVFLAVAAFLVNVVLSRLIGTQREQIASLKALGYRNSEVAIHYLQLVLVVLTLGSALGFGLGTWGGAKLVQLYTQFFKFPGLEYRLDWRSTITSLLVASIAALGSLFAVRQAAILPPAEGMRPPAPPTYKPLLVDRLGLGALLTQGARMILRDLQRTPMRLALSALGVGSAIAMLIAGRFSGDALDQFFATHFQLIEREPLNVTFMEPVRADALRAISALPGVLRVEPMRWLPVRLRAGHIRYDTVIRGTDKDADLYRVIDRRNLPIRLPDEGMLITPQLGERMNITVGDEVIVEALDGTGRIRTVRVVGWFEQVVTLMPVMERHALDRLFGDEGIATSAAVNVDPQQIEQVTRSLKEMPRVGGAISLTRMVKLFEEQNTDVLRVITAILVVFASAICVGVVYNNARVALAVRARDLATLRVLGYTRREISALLIGEISAGVLLAVPLGLLMGELLVHAIASSFDPEMFRLDPVVTAGTRGFAVGVALLAAAASALLVRRRLDSLDLVSVLKAPE